MTIDLAFDDADLAIVDQLERFCAERFPDEVLRTAGMDFNRDRWLELAELGVLSLGIPGGEGGAPQVVAAMEALGRGNVPGPLIATFVATQLLPEPQLTAVASGQALVSLGAPPLMPWAPVADLFVVIEGERAWLGEPRQPVESLDTLGGEPWGRVELGKTADLGDLSRAQTLGEIARAAYLAAAGRHLLDDASEYARTRIQFGRAIGEFQAIAHPLADRAMQLDAATALARCAAESFDAGAPGTRSEAAAARLSATRAALEAVYTAHQVFGALGATSQGPAFYVARRVRQLASLPPSVQHAHEAVLEPFGL